MKEVKKIAKYLGIFIVCLIVFDVLFGFVVDRLWNNMPDTVSQTAKTNTFLNKVEADVIILGSSTAAHHYDSQILQDSLGMSVYNCGHEGMDLIYCDAILESIIKRHVPKIVILDMFESYLKGNDQRRLDGLTPYIKSDQYIAKIMKELKGNSYSALRLCNMYRYNDRLLNLVNAYSSAPEENRGFTPLSSNTNMAGKEPTPWLQIQDNEVDELEKNHFLHIVELCEANGIELFIVNSPRYNFEEAPLAYTKSICEGKKVVFLDYSDLFIDEPEMFRDPSHLLADGAEKFSKKFAERIVTEIKQKLQY